MFQCPDCKWHFIILKKTNESLRFQRGLDPKEAMGIGPKALIKKWFDDLDIPPEKYVINTDLSIDYKYGLDLENTPITSLPDNLRVNGSLWLNNTQITSLPDNLRVNGSLWLTNTPITSLPDNLTVKGYLDLSNTPITNLPDNLRVKGNLYLNNTKITSLPDNLRFKGNLYLTNTPITSLPDNLRVNGEIVGFEPKVVKESLEFQRGLDPKQAMNIGVIHEIENWLKSEGQFIGEKLNSSEWWSLVLCKCAFYDKSEYISLCLDNGADIHIENERPLRNAVFKCNFKTGKILIDNGASLKTAKKYSKFVNNNTNDYTAFEKYLKNKNKQ
jgi:hypothetical protein